MSASRNVTFRTKGEAFQELFYIYRGTKKVTPEQLEATLKSIHHSLGAEVLRTLLSSSIDKLAQDIWNEERTASLLGQNSPTTIQNIDSFKIYSGSSIVDKYLLRGTQEECKIIAAYGGEVNQESADVITNIMTSRVIRSEHSISPLIKATENYRAAFTSPSNKDHKESDNSQWQQRTQQRAAAPRQIVR